PPSDHSPQLCPLQPAPFQPGQPRPASLLPALSSQLSPDVHRPGAGRVLEPIPLVGSASRTGRPLPATADLVPDHRGLVVRLLPHPPPGASFSAAADRPSEPSVRGATSAAPGHLSRQTGCLGGGPALAGSVLRLGAPGRHRAQSVVPAGQPPEAAPPQSHRHRDHRACLLPLLSPAPSPVAPADHRPSSVDQGPLDRGVCALSHRTVGSIVRPVRRGKPAPPARNR